MRLLLDTSAFLWYISGDSPVPVRVREAIAKDGTETYLSSVSIWELSVKLGLGKLLLPAPVAVYAREQRERQGFLALPLCEDDIEHLAKLPDHHRDPFDRMLICQSLQNGLRLVSNDSAIIRYPVPIFW
jgi:PIN domain nuclease of toxin-antitoxin system